MFSDDTPAKSGTVRLFHTRILPFCRYCACICSGLRAYRLL